MTQTKRHTSGNRQQTHDDTEVYVYEKDKAEPCCELYKTEADGREVTYRQLLIELNYEFLREFVITFYIHERKGTPVTLAVSRSNTYANT
jgi:hypothetical protein